MMSFYNNVMTLKDSIQHLNHDLSVMQKEMEILIIQEPPNLCGTWIQYLSSITSSKRELHYNWSENVAVNNSLCVFDVAMVNHLESKDPTEKFAVKDRSSLMMQF